MESLLYQGLRGHLAHMAARKTKQCERGIGAYNRTLRTVPGDPHSLLTYDEWMQNLAVRGVNIIVLQWAGKNRSGGADLEPPPWGTYNIWHSVLDPDNLDRYRADQVAYPVEQGVLEASNAYKLVRAAEKHGVGLWICFSTFWEFWRDSYWKYHAWNKDNRYVNGTRCQEQDRGFLEHQRDLLTDETAILAAKKRIKFVMDTFGGSDAVAMWEVMGEACFMVNYKFWGLPEYNAPVVLENIRTKVIPWLEEMMQFIRDNDPRSRPVTISHPRVPPAEWSDNPHDYHNMATEIVCADGIDFVPYHDYISQGDLDKAARILRLLQEKFPSHIIGNGAYWPFAHTPTQQEPVNEPAPHLDSREMQWLYTCGQRCGFALRQEGFEEREINDWVRGGYADTDLQDVAGVTKAFCERVKWEEWSPQAAAWDERITTDANLCVSSGDGAHVSMMLRWSEHGHKDVTVHGLDNGDYVLDIFNWVTGDLVETVQLAVTDDSLTFRYDVSFERNILVACLGKEGDTGPGGCVELLARALRWLRRMRGGD